MPASDPLEDMENKEREFNEELNAIKSGSPRHALDTMFGVASKHIAIADYARRDWIKFIAAYEVVSEKLCGGKE